MIHCQCNLTICDQPSVNLTETKKKVVEQWFHFIPRSFSPRKILDLNYHQLKQFSVLESLFLKMENFRGFYFCKSIFSEFFAREDLILRKLILLLTCAITREFTQQLGVVRIIFILPKFSTVHFFVTLQNFLVIANCSNLY